MRDLDAGKWFAHAAAAIVVRHIDAEKRRGFRQAVADRDLPAERFEFAASRIEGEPPEASNRSFLPNRLCNGTKDYFARMNA